MVGRSRPGQEPLPEQLAQRRAGQPAPSGSHMPVPLQEVQGRERVMLVKSALVLLMV